MGEKGKGTRPHHNGSLAVSLTPFMLPSYSIHAITGLRCFRSQNSPVWGVSSALVALRGHTALHSGAAGLKAVLPDLTQAHHSNSSTFGLLYRENHSGAQSFLYLWSSW